MSDVLGREPDARERRIAEIRERLALMYAQPGPDETVTEFQNRQWYATVTEFQNRQWYATVTEFQNRQWYARHELSTGDIAFLLSLVDSLRADAQRMEDALHPFGQYAICREAAPLRGLDDVIHAIHLGTPWESELRLSDCKRAAAVLGYDASRLRTPGV